MSTWQPIETAPKDGSYFLASNAHGVWVAHWEEFSPGGFRFDQPYRTVMLNHWHIADKANQYRPPTHWMPLPAPPDSAAGHLVAQPADADELQRLRQQVERLTGERDALAAKLNSPELRDFAAGVVMEAAHQRERWGAAHDAGKEPQDWFWLLGYLGGKALKAHTSGDHDKAMHHTISSAAALANWHAAISGAHTAMRPGIDPVARGIESARTNGGTDATA